MMEPQRRISRALGARAVILLVSIAATVFLGCAGIGGGRNAPSVARTQDGFTITDSARPRMGLRWEFDEAREALENGDHGRAIDLLVAITVSDPDFAAPHINLAIAYRETRRYEEAVAALNRALEVSPRHPVANNEMGIAYRRLGRFDEARSAYQAALDLYPNFHYARKNLAIVCDLFLSDEECAVEQYQIYHEAVPEDEEVAIWIADLENRAGR